jgi:hypothetical protein
LPGIADITQLFEVLQGRVPWITKGNDALTVFQVGKFQQPMIHDKRQKDDKVESVAIFAGIYFSVFFGGLPGYPLVIQHSY